MRDIKFKAWDSKRKQFIEKFKLTPFGKLQIYTGREWCYAGDTVKLMQYTGLKDKNGVEIYEGDIVTMHTEWAGSHYGEDEGGEYENKGVVAIVPSKGVMINRCMKRDIIECDEEWKKTWSVNVRGYRSVVIGNIYEV